MTTKISKAPELLLAGEVLELFISDCTVPSKTKLTPYQILEQMLVLYCAFLGVRQPSAKQLGAALSARYPKGRLENCAAYQLGIKPGLITIEGKQNDQ